MKSVIAVLALALTGVIAAPAACPNKATPQPSGDFGKYDSYGSYKDAKLPENYGKYSSYGSYKDAKLPEHYGKYDKYGSYKRDGEAQE